MGREKCFLVGFLFVVINCIFVYESLTVFHNMFNSKEPEVQTVTVNL